MDADFLAFLWASLKGWSVIAIPATAALLIFLHVARYDKDDDNGS